MPVLGAQRPLVIGLIADAPGSGKTTAAYGLRTMRNRVLYAPFAASLKRMTEALLLDIGLTEQEVHRRLREAKQERIDQLGCTARTIMQVVGTECGRSIDENFWIYAWRARVKRLCEQGDPRMIVVDDCRFRNECSAIKQMNGEIWRIVRDEHIRLESKHPSEGGLVDWPADRVIENNGTIPELQDAVFAALLAAEQRHMELVR